jgi:hypothetical protein
MFLTANNFPFQEREKKERTNERTNELTKGPFLSIIRLTRFYDLSLTDPPFALLNVIKFGKTLIKIYVTKMTV